MLLVRLYDPTAAGDSTGEWFEVYNPQVFGVDLVDWTIGDNANATAATINSSTWVPPGEYAVFGVNGDTTVNGNVALDYAHGSTPAFNNGGDSVILTAADGTMVDTVDYSQVGFADPSGASLSLDPLIVDATFNDVGLSWCASTVAWPSSAGDFGTPGTANPSCLLLN